MNITHKDAYEEFLYVWSLPKPDDYSEREKRLIFLTDRVLELTTYCDDYSLRIGEQILDIIKSIHYFHNKKDVHTKPEINYCFPKSIGLQYTYIVYVQFIIQYLSWGTSIRSAWFDTDEKILGYKLTPKNVSYLISWFENIG